MIHLRDVNKKYEVAGEAVVGLDDATLDLERGDFVCLRGASGSGKTTLLLTIGGMQRPSSGTVGIADSQDIYALSSAERTRLRARHIGFVFQLFHLVPYLNVVENIRLGVNATGNSKSDAEQGADQWIEKLGLTHRCGHSPSQLSVGECQRVAIARALVSHPDILLADEPTGNLDAENAEIVVSALQEFCQGGGVLLFATHSDQPMQFANRRLHIDTGRVKELE